MVSQWVSGRQWGAAFYGEITVGLTNKSKLASEQRLEVHEEAHHGVHWKEHILSEGTASSEALREGRARCALFLRVISYGWKWTHHHNNTNHKNT